MYLLLQQFLNMFKATTYFTLFPFRISFSYVLDATIFPAMSLMLIHLVAKSKGEEGLRMFDSRVGKVVLANCIILVMTLILKDLLYKVDFPHRRMQSSLILLFSFMFVFINQAIILKDKSIKEAFVDNLQVIKRQWLVVLIIFLVTLAGNLISYFKIVDLNWANKQLQARLLYMVYTSIKFILLNLFLTFIYIKDKSKEIIYSSKRAS